MDAAAWIGTAEVAETLGCSKAISLDIMKSELVTVLSENYEQGQSVFVVHRREIDTLMEAVREKVCFEQGNTPWKSMHAMRRYGGAVGVLRLLRDGHLTRLYCSSLEIRLENIHADFAELERVPRHRLDGRHAEESDAELLDTKSARRRLKVTGSLIEVLVKEGLVGYVDVENQVRWKGRSRRFIKRSDLDRFARDHISIAHLSVERSI